MSLGLLIGGLSSCVIGFYHFLLPFVWHWSESLVRLPPTLRWGCYSINFFFSYLLLGGGVLTLIARNRIRSGRVPDRGMIVGMAGFWLLNTAYQICLPIPLPEGLSRIHHMLLGIGAATAAAYGIALVGDPIVAAGACGQDR